MESNRPRERKVVKWVALALTTAIVAVVVAPLVTPVVMLASVLNPVSKKDWEGY